MRVPGFGPGLKAWEAFVLPLHYTRGRKENFSRYINLSCFNRTFPALIFFSAPKDCKILLFSHTCTPDINGGYDY